uniref:Protein fuzzy n=1 Tax=Lygus hesperus TaxID=30085 RepID=A0A0K8T009_LYGHE
MGANIVCVTSSGGLPIFSRKIGNVESLSFSTIGSLNGVHLFGKSKGLLLESTETENSTVVWKEYDDSLILICVAVMNGQEVVEEIIETVYNALIVFVGTNEIKNFKNVERFKRSLRPSYPIIDCILECLDFGDRNTNLDLLKLVEAILCREGKTLQIALDSFVEVIGTQFGWLTIENCVAAATDGWWSLVQIKRKLLSHIVRSSSHCTCFDMPIYLPFKSPTVPIRLVSVCLINPIRVNVLCGSSPDLSAISQKSYQCWSPIVDTLKLAVQSHPRNIPSNLGFHDSINGFLLINMLLGKFLLCTSLKSTKKDSKSCAETLKSFYYNAVRILEKSETLHQPLETYWVAEYHKLHAIKEGDDLICVLFHSGIPTPCMRLISRETLNIIVSQGELSWSHSSSK